MADKNPRRNPTTDALFDAILSLETREECYNFFEDLCTVKEISDMAQRLEAAKLLLSGSTYDQVTAFLPRRPDVTPALRSSVPSRWCRGSRRSRTGCSG